MMNPLAKRVFDGGQDGLARAFLAGYLENSVDALNQFTELLEGTGSDFDHEEHAFACGRAFALGARAAIAVSIVTADLLMPVQRMRAAERAEVLPDAIVQLLARFVERSGLDFGQEHPESPPKKH